MNWINFQVRELEIEDFYWFVASVSIVAAWFGGVSIIMVALEKWGLVNLDWARAIWNWVVELWLKIIELEFVERPLIATQNILAALSADRRFDTDNEGFIIMFTWFVYPIIWNFSLPSAIFNVFVLPVYMILFLVDKELFVDEEASELAGRNVPVEGIPTSFSKAYNI